MVRSTAIARKGPNTHTTRNKSARRVFRMTLVPDEHENQAGDRDQQIGKDVDRAQYAQTTSGTL